MASIADVARSAGVSTGTVWNVLNNRRVTAENREVVLRAMDEIGYEPTAQRRVRSGLSRKADLKSVTLITLGQSVKDVLRQPVYFDLIHGVERACDQEGLPFRLRALPTAEDCGRLDVQKGEGLLLFGQDGGGLDPSLRDRVPVVHLFGEGSMEPALQDFDRVSYDDAAVGCVAADWLFQRGCREVGVISPKGLPRREAAVRRLEHHGCSVQAMDVARWPGPLGSASAIEAAVDDDEWLREGLRQLMTSNRPVTGIFLHSDVLAAHAYPILHAMGVQPNRDVAIISCNNDEAYLRGLAPQPATIDIHVDAVGRTAVGLLLDRALQPDDPVKTVLLKPSIIDS